MECARKPLIMHNSESSRSGSKRHKVLQNRMNLLRWNALRLDRRLTWRLIRWQTRSPRMRRKAWTLKDLKMNYSRSFKKRKFRNAQRSRGLRMQWSMEVFRRLCELITLSNVQVWQAIRMTHKLLVMMGLLCNRTWMLIEWTLKTSLAGINCLVLSYRKIMLHFF